jgi:hypothetical protein
VTANYSREMFKNHIFKLSSKYDASQARCLIQVFTTEKRLDCLQRNNNSNDNNNNNVDDNNNKSNDNNNNNNNSRNNNNSNNNSNDDDDDDNNNSNNNKSRESSKLFANAIKLFFFVRKNKLECLFPAGTFNLS